MALFVKKLEDHAATMVGYPLHRSCGNASQGYFYLQPETVEQEGEPNILASLAPPTPGQSTLVNSAAGAAGALAGWAISSIGKKVRLVNAR